MSNNPYRRNRKKDGRVLVALVTVTIMAAGIMGLYGVLNLFTEDVKTQSETAVATAPAIEAEKGVTNISSEAGITASVKEDKKDNPKAEKTDIKDLVKADKETEEAYYKDTVFIGDSRTQGLQINAGLKSPDFFAGRGLNVKNARTEKVVKNAGGKSVTVINALKDKQYKKVYICYGINELGWPYTNIFADEYKKTINEIKEIQPDAEIVVQAILPVTEKKSKSDKIFNMKNIKKFNKVIKAMAEEIGASYVDLSPAVANKKGFLPKDVTPDGVHMNREYCKRILAYIVNMNY